VLPTEAVAARRAAWATDAGCAERAAWATDAGCAERAAERAIAIQRAVDSPIERVTERVAEPTIGRTVFLSIERAPEPSAVPSIAITPALHLVSASAFISA
jgi:hypothetical protein